MRTARFLSVVVMLSTAAGAAPRIDNVLIRMVPPGVNSLVGANMETLKASDLYQKLMAQQKLPQLDQFARETGFDPRRDVRELLLTAGPKGSVLLARGKFSLTADAGQTLTLVRYGQFNIRTMGQSGFCILDTTLAVAGELPAIEAALDEAQRGTHTAAQPLLGMLATMNPQTPLWGVSTGFASFLAANLPRAGNGVDFSAIFQGIERTWFSASMTSGFQAAIHGITASEHDAVTLRDTAKGLIGLGRLSVPETQPDLLRFWDGITVEQSGNLFTLNVDIAGNLIDQMVRTLTAGPGAGRGARGASGRGGRGGRSGSGARGAGR